MPNRATTVRFPIFSGYTVRVIHAANIVQTGRKLGADLTGCDAAFITKTETPGHGWLVFGATDPATIAHEASHAVRALFRFAGAKADDEAFAYHLDFLVGKVHKFLEGRCGRISKARAR